MPDAYANSRHHSPDTQEDDRALKVVGFTGWGLGVSFSVAKFPTTAVLVVSCSDDWSVARLASLGHIHRPTRLFN